MPILLLPGLLNLGSVGFVFDFVFFALFLEKLHPVRYKMFWRAIVQTVTYAAVAAHFVVLLESVILLTTSVILLTTLFFFGS